MDKMLRRRELPLVRRRSYCHVDRKIKNDKEAKEKE